MALKVLIVEDCEDDRDLILLNLHEAGFDLNETAVDTLDEIESCLASSDWQLIISDFDLPGFNGIRALELVRAHNPDIPFFIVSGVIDEEQAVAAMKAGAQDYFFKGKLARLGPAITRELREAEQRRKRQEAQAALDRDRDILRHDRIRFIDVMSHEFRTPLNIINVAAGMLARYADQMDAGARGERLSEIQSAVGRMTRIIDKVLLTSRLELHRWELQSEVFDLAAWCKAFIAETCIDTRGRIRLRIGTVPAKVAMDCRVLDIALQNLLSNALKYSPPESTVDLEITGTESGRVQFTIRDRGIGIPPADVPHVMSAFFRGGNVGDVPGTGLGLAIVKGCMDVHGGTIEVDSKPEAGTTVTIRLPDWLRVKSTPQEVSAPPAEVLSQ
jgi:signal transduction histidine kinase